MRVYAKKERLGGARGRDQPPPGGGGGGGPCRLPPAAIRWGSTPPRNGGARPWTGTSRCRWKAGRWIMPDDLHLTIDGQPVTVPVGTTILQAARSAGIEIPGLCYFDHTTSNGLCRLCVGETDGAR